MTVTVDTGSTERIVTDKFETTQEFAADLWTVAKEFLEELQSGTYSFSIAGIDTDIDLIDTNVADPEAPDKPTTELTLPDEVSDIEMDTVVLEPVDSVSLSAVAPVIVFPEEPSVIWPTDPGEPPVVTYPDAPVKPSYDLPVLPILSDIVIPSAPSLDIPSFNGVLPVDDIDPPSSIFVYDEPMYESALLDAVNAKLLEEIDLGGTGLAVDIEAAIWERARARLELEKERKYTEVEDYFGARGFNIPPGALSSGLMEVIKENARADEQINYEVMIEQARLAQTNTHFIITSVIQQEANIMAYISSRQTRVLEAAKFTQEAAIAVFNALVAEYGKKLLAYQTYASVYESRIRASGLILENYRVQLEGAKITSDIQRQSVELYKVQIDAVNMLAELYKTEMEVMRTQTEIERLKLEGFKEKVEVYTARLNAVVSNYNIYQARIAGEVAKASVYSEQVKAYVGEVGAKKIEADINIAEANVTIEGNRIKIEKLKVDIEKFNAHVTARVAEVETDARIYGYDIDRYKADVDRASSEISANIDKYSAESQHITNAAKVVLAQSEIFLREVGRKHELDLEKVKAGATIAAQMAASALSAVAVGAQLNVRAGLSAEVGEYYNHNLSI